MKKACVIIGLCLAVSQTVAEDLVSPEGLPSEEEQLIRLGEATKRSLDHIKRLQENLMAFRKQEALSIQSPDDVEALYALSQCALRLINSIREARLEPYFRPAFVEELARLSKTAESKTIPPICPH